MRLPKHPSVGAVRDSHSYLYNCSDITVSVGPCQLLLSSCASLYATEGLCSAVVLLSQIVQMSPDKGSDGSVHPKWALYLKTNGMGPIKKPP